MILEQGDKVLIVHRRLFSEDSQRFFIGVVDGYEQGVAKVTGHSWVRDPFVSAPVRKEGARTKIFALSSGTLIVYALPASTELRTLIFENDGDGHLFLCDGNHVRLDVSEATHKKARAL